MFNESKGAVVSYNNYFSGSENIFAFEDVGIPACAVH